jgi:hypothetical protein
VKVYFTPSGQLGVFQHGVIPGIGHRSLSAIFDKEAAFETIGGT